MKRLVLTLVLCLPVFAAPAIIRNALAIAINDSAHVLRTGDFNGDGNLDFATRGVKSVQIVLGNGDGSFDAPVEITLPSGQGLEFADLDADDDLDFIVSYFNANETMSFHTYLNNGAGSFASGNVLAVTANGVFALADVTGDSKPDLVTCGAQYYPGSGNGTFGALVAFSACLSNDIDYVFDADNDGDNDILVANPYAQSRIYHNDGTGVLTAVDIVLNANRVAIGDFDDNDLPDIGWIDSNGRRRVALASAGGTYTFQTPGSDYARARNLIAPDLNGDGRADLIAGGYELTRVWLSEPGGTAGAYTLYAGGNGAAAIATGDFDGDGNADVITVGDIGAINVATPQTQVSLLRGTGDGSLDAPRSHQVSRTGMAGDLTTSSMRSVGLSDVNGDGFLDLAVSTEEGPLATFIGIGDGSFGAQVVTSVASAQKSVFADFNGDGRKDVARLTSGALEVWLAQSTGLFLNSASVSADFSDPLTGDFDGDGKQDVVLFNQFTLSFRHGNGDGTLAEPVDTPLGIIDYTHLVSGDFNNDGRDDIATGVWVLLAQADGRFMITDASAPADPTLTADLNADGYLDLVYARNAPERAVITHLGNGDGSFRSPRRTFLFSHAYIGPEGAAADIDGDGNTDVVLGSTVLLGDGTGGFDGYARFRMIGGSQAVAVGDIDKNGSIDLITGTSAFVNVVLTRTTDSLDLPLTVTVEELDAPFTLGSTQTAEAEVLGETFAAEGAVMFALNGVVGAFAEPFDGEAAASFMIAPAGDGALTAIYSGDAIYAAATSSPTPPMTVAKATVLTNASFFPSLPTWENQVRVAGRFSQSVPYIQPTGTIAVILDGNPHSTIAAPTFDINFGQLSIGTHSVVLQYSGDANFNAHETLVSFTVGKPTAPFQFSMTPVGSYPLGATATLKAFFPNHPSITGVVRFYRDSTILGEATISNAMATLDVVMTVPVGNARFDATFLGDELYAQTEVDHWDTGITDISFAPGPTSLYLLTPCRVIDTRNPNGDYGGPTVSFVRKFLMAGRCGIPFGAKALAVNITAVNPPSAGYFIFYAAPEFYPPFTGVSTISYRPNRTHANNAIVGLSAGGYMGIYNGHYELPVHVLVDVTGYFK
ncbi:MAG TPA: FG-GAP-like repeat-containing protein [Thermoanaerobaculia bacterium]